MRKFTFQVRFNKVGRARFIPHRELMTLIERAVRRADIPVALSEGFNPRPRISFLGALSLGVPSEDEVIYLHLAEWLSPAEVQKRLNAQLCSLFVSDLLTQNKQLIRITEVIPQHSSDNPKEFSVEYRISNGGGDFSGEYKNKAGDLLAKKEILVLRENSEGQKGVDIRPYIEDIKVDNNIIVLTAKVTNRGTVRPDEIIEALGLNEAFTQGVLSIMKAKTIFK
ncbi:MAG: TIGR03936 family radical SAM-associated protein [Candidatus Brocadiia bacterium]